MTEILESNLLKDTAVEAILNRKGKEIVVMDLNQVHQSIADYFIICHGNSNTQVMAIADNVEKELREKINERLIHKEGAANSQWILLDYGNVVVHVFQESYRRFYNLEDLWADAGITVINND